MERHSELVLLYKPVLLASPLTVSAQSKGDDHIDCESHTRGAVCYQNWCKHICWCAQSQGDDHIDRQSHIRGAICCQNWCKHMCWCADSCPGVSRFVEEVPLSAARRSLVCLLRCIPYDGFSLLFPRRGVCFLFRCIPRGQLRAMLWHWTQGQARCQAQAIVEDNRLLLPGFTCVCLTLNVCTVRELFFSRATVNVSSFGRWCGHK